MNLPSPQATTIGAWHNFLSLWQALITHFIAVQITASIARMLWGAIWPSHAWWSKHWAAYGDDMSEGWKRKQCLTLRLDKVSGAKECQDQVQGSKFGSSWLWWCRVSVHLISFMKPPSAKNHTDARTQTAGEAVRYRYPFLFYSQVLMRFSLKYSPHLA